MAGSPLSFSICSSFGGASSSYQSSCFLLLCFPEILKWQSLCLLLPPLAMLVGLEYVLRVISQAGRILSLFLSLVNTRLLLKRLWAHSLWNVKWPGWIPIYTLILMLSTRFLGFLWGRCLVNLLMLVWLIGNGLHHFGRKWFALEFTDEDDLKFVLKNQPWYVRGQIFHLERWTTNFKNTDVITKLVVWAHLPCVLVQYKEEKIMKDIT